MRAGGDVVCGSVVRNGSMDVVLSPASGNVEAMTSTYPGTKKCRVHGGYLVKRAEPERGTQVTLDPWHRQPADLLFVEEIRNGRIRD